MALTIATATRNAAANAVTTLVDGGSGAGKLRIYDGTRPAGPDTAVSTQTLLAEVTLSDPSFGSASSGVITLASLPKSATGVGAGTASWFRVLDSTNAAVVDGAAGTSGTNDLVLTTATISVGLALSLTACTITMPGS